MIGGRQTRRLPGSSFLQDPTKRKAVRRRAGGVNRVPQEVAEALKGDLRLYLEYLGIAITAPVFEPGASEIGFAEGEVYEAGYRIYRTVWSLFGCRCTKEQILVILWPELGNLAPWAREQFGLPMRRCEVMSWIWGLRNGQ